MSTSRKRMRENNGSHIDTQKASSESKRIKINLPEQDCVPKLTDICAKFVAENFPFQQVEEELPQIPEPIQERIVFWAFPRSEKDVALYSSMHIHLPVNEYNKQPFQHGIRFVENGNVSEVLQIGFHLSGTVKETQGICQQRKVCYYRVSLKFDRCKITSVSCGCNNRSVLWCSHAVALALYRIRHANHVPVRLPVSETILQLKTPQLQRLLLHLITQHHQDILPSVQNLLDDLVRPDSEISLSQGIPDPTAGACTGTVSSWYLDSDLIHEEIKSGLSATNTGKNINSLFNKVREMFSANDNNAIELLSLVTDGFMEAASTSHSNDEPLSDKVKKLWENLISVWVCAVLNPKVTEHEKERLRVCLETWSTQSHCPRIDKETMEADFVNSDISPHGIFQLAISALNWNLDFAEDDVIVGATYVDALRCHGYREEALDLAVAIGQNIQQFSMQDDLQLDRFNPTLENKTGWLGHILDPIGALFDILFEAAEKTEEKHYFLPLAIEVAFAGLSQIRTLPAGQYAQMRMCHREEQLLAQLEEVDFSTRPLKAILCQVCESLQSRLRMYDDHSISPSHSFSRFLFNKMLPLDRELAYSFGVSAIPLFVPASDENEDELINESPNLICHIKSHLESQQSELAASMLKGCCTELRHLKSVVSSINSHLHSASQLFRLAKLASSLADDSKAKTSSSTRSSLLEAGLQLGIKAVELTRTETSWERREMVRWLVSSAVLHGKEAVETLVIRWAELFTPQELSKDVATILTSQPVLFQLRMNKLEEKSFMSKLRGMLIEGAIRDPASCALFSLTLCENDTESFDLACQIVNESVSRLNTTQLFAIARYLESKGYQQRALKVAMLAIKQIDIGPEQESHPAVCDIFWACTLACSLGKDELTQITPIISNCVRNPLVLTELARRCVRTSSFYSGTNCKKKCANLSYDKEPISRLLATAQQLFVQEVQSKLTNITPKHYSDFTQYLEKVRTSFQLVDDGNEQFQWLLDFIATSQRGKKKLLKLIRESVAKCES